MPRAVLDTNVVVSALIWGGKPFALVRAAIEGDLALYTSPALLKELGDVLARDQLAARLRGRQTSVEQAMVLYASLAQTLDPPALSAPISRDPDDDAILALASALKVDVVVTGDNDLLVLVSYNGIPIVTPARALALLER